MLLVALFFMHLLYKPGLTRIASVIGLLWLALLVSLTLTDVYPPLDRAGKAVVSPSYPPPETFRGLRTTIEPWRLRSMVNYQTQNAGEVAERLKAAVC